MTSSSEISENLTTAEAEARKRRERILDRKRKLQSKSNNTAGTEESIETIPELSAPNTDDTTGKEVEVLSRSLQERVTSTTEPEEMDVNRVVSRKVDWDLKKGIEKHLAILQDRTNEVVAEIVREQLLDEE